MKGEVDILDYLVSNIRNSMNEMADHISTGGCESFDAYTKLLRNHTRTCGSRKRDSRSKVQI
jgi:hypothetical protein